MNWTSSAHCTSRAHCLACRNDPAFRASIVKAGMADTKDFACPHGAQIGQTEKLPQPKRGLGDLIEAAVKPIAVALKLDCLDQQQKLKPESPCAQRRDRLNKIKV